MPIQVKIKKTNPSAILPQYATDGANCFDIHSLTAGYVLKQLPLVCKTGLSFEIPEHHVMLVFSRSGHGFKSDVRLSNCVGIIDSDYRGELAVKLAADQDSHNAGDPFSVKVGDRVAQAMVIPVERVIFEEVDELGGTQRGTGGFGSTGK